MFLRSVERCLVASLPFVRQDKSDQATRKVRNLQPRNAAYGLTHVFSDQKTLRQKMVALHPMETSV